MGLEPLGQASLTAPSTEGAVSGRLWVRGRQVAEGIDRRRARPSPGVVRDACVDPGIACASKRLREDEPRL